MKRASSYRTTVVWWVVAGSILLASRGTVRADFTFGEPGNLGPTINSSFGEWDPDISTDGLFLYFGSMRPGGYGPDDIWVATRATVHDAWDIPVNLGPKVNGPDGDSDPSLSADGRTLFFTSYRSGGYGGRDIWVTTRATTDDLWEEPVNLGPTVNSARNESDPSISDDGLSLYFSTFDGPRAGGLGGDDIWVTTRPSLSDPWGEPMNLGSPVNTSHNDFMPSISADGRMLFFSSDRPGGYGGPRGDIWLTTRATTDGPWDEPINLGPRVNTSDNDGDPEVSADGLWLYFNCRNRPGGIGPYDIWQAPIIPLFDFNGDGKVDGFEVCRMADRWGTDDSLCDIGPMPWGDGVVDVEDLKVLAKYIGEPVDDPTLVAHWAFDETEGATACDSAGGNGGTIMGLPQWCPGGGRIAGALELHGTTFVTAPCPLSPAHGPFSVLAWVKGGVPGQVMISQEDGANWLMLDPATGVLMTELISGAPSRSTPVLYSDAIIMDGNWHRIGFTWDGSNRRLYVDDVLVAEDAQTGLAGSFGRHYIGCGSDRASETFFTGLMDDVRIYSRAVKP